MDYTKKVPPLLEQLIHRRIEADLLYRTYLLDMFPVIGEEKKVMYNTDEGVLNRLNVIAPWLYESKEERETKKRNELKSTIAQLKAMNKE